jgi:purine nucleoside permease
MYGKKSLPKRFFCLALMATAGFLAAPMAASAAAMQVKVLVLTAFPPELVPWRAHLDHPVSFDVPGAYAPVWCEADGVCVTETGEGQVNAASSVAAILLSPVFDLSHAIVLRAGIAGGPPWGDGTLGGAYWADWVVSWDFGYHLPAISSGQKEPRFLPLGSAKPPLGTQVLQLNPTLVALAYAATRDTPLADDAAAARARTLYPGQGGRRPALAIGAVVVSDEFWIGAAFSREAEAIVDEYTNGTAHYATSAEEDTGDAGALARRSMLSHYLSLRTVSDFDQPPAGETPAAMALADTFPGGDIAIENAYRVAHAFIAYVLAHPLAIDEAIGADSVPRTHYPLDSVEAMGR